MHLMDFRFTVSGIYSGFVRSGICCNGCAVLMVGTGLCHGLASSGSCRILVMLFRVTVSTSFRAETMVDSLPPTFG